MIWLYIISLLAGIYLILSSMIYYEDSNDSTLTILLALGGCIPILNIGIALFWIIIGSSNS